MEIESPSTIRKSKSRSGGGVSAEAQTLLLSCKQVAAALPAAVTTTKIIGDAPTFQAEATMQNRTPQTPAALREGARGRGFSQRSRLPRPPVRPPLREGARGRGFSKEKPLPRSLSVFHYIMLFLFVGRILGVGKRKTYPQLLKGLWINVCK